jgi:molybdopterin molybdotransferase
MSMTTVEALCAHLRAHAARMPIETVPLAQSLHRTLAQPIRASRAQPPFPASAMDGYALRTAGLAELAATGLEVIGEAAAGRPFTGAIGPSQAVRIFTGAPVPDGADAVVAQERTERIECTPRTDHPRRGAGPGNRENEMRPARVRIEPEIAAAIGPGANIRSAGIDFAPGEELIAAGTRLHARHVALLAAAGCGELAVRRRPRVAVLPNGDELRRPGERAGPAEIYDSVTPGVSAMIEDWGGQAHPAGAAPDDPAAIRDAVRQAAAADVLVIVGGASVGDHDHVKGALRELGLELAVSRVAVRPGKPTWFGTLPDTRRPPPGASSGALERALPVLGLPGNPAAAFVCAHLFLRALIEAMLGAASAPLAVTAALEGRLAAVGPEEHYVRAHVRASPDARLVVRPDPRQDTSLVSVYASSNALIRRPAQEPAATWGSFVEVLMLDEASSCPWT